MAIAGLHIGSIAGFFYLLIFFIWRHISCLTLRVPAKIAATYAAMIVGLIYSMLAGFSLPTIRASTMLILFSLMVICKRNISAWFVWSLALFLILLLNPLSVLTDSMWLSFGTIALLIYGMGGRLNPSGLWWHWGRAQWVIGVGLIPLSLLFFQSISSLSFIANTIAIPFLTFLILPFCFLSIFTLTFAPTITKLCLYLADKNLAYLWLILKWLAHQSYSLWYMAIPNNYIMFTTVIACLLMLLPPGMPGRVWSMAWLMPLFFYHAPSPKPGDVWLSVLDVGQGLSICLRTAKHVLIYDAGPKLGERDAGQDVVLPYLRTLQIKKIDMMVISHGDNDHIGGAKAIIQSLPVAVIKTSAPEKLLYPATSNCIANENWEWDGVKFAFLYPVNADMKNANANDRSCVLRVDDGKHVILLPGDIEKKPENYLLHHALNQLPATLLIAPHHGSKTSGAMKFITAIHPGWVIFATGYKNRYHFPHPSVVANFTAAAVTQFNMPLTGTLSILISSNLNLPLFEEYRFENQRYWMDLTD